MNIPAKVDFTDSIFQGSTFYESFYYTQEDGTPIDLDGFTGKMQVRILPGKKILTTFDTSDSSMFLNRSEALLGTVDASGSNIITGTGTDFTALKIGDRVTFASLSGQKFNVAAINSATEIEIDQSITITGDTISIVYVGRIELRKEASETVDWKADKYQYDLELSQAIEIFKLMRGMFVVNSEITL